MFAPSAALAPESGKWEAGTNAGLFGHLGEFLTGSHRKEYAHSYIRTAVAKIAEQD